MNLDVIDNATRLLDVTDANGDPLDVSFIEDQDIPF